MEYGFTSAHTKQAERKGLNLSRREEGQEKELPTLSKTAGQPIYISATFKNTGSAGIKNLNVGFALYGPQSIGGYAYLLGPLDVGASVSISNQKATETIGLPAGSYTLRMYFSDGQGVTPFGQYDVSDWTISIVAGAPAVTPSGVSLSAVKLREAKAIAVSLS